jgi:hypothetical protein
MKLRNKKTGEIADLECITIFECSSRTLGIGESVDEFYTIAELNEKWEDYTPKEPLIEDEKIRKAVRAWAEACGFVRLYFDEYHNALRNIDERAFTTISLPRDVDEDTLPLEDGKTYTIAELCGEEEE